jgi:hypothetical protein
VYLLLPLKENHFFCHGCQTTLKSGEFTAFESKPFCKNCYGKLPVSLRKENLKKRIELLKKQKQDKYSTLPASIAQVIEEPVRAEPQLSTIDPEKIQIWKEYVNSLFNSNIIF